MDMCINTYPEWLPGINGSKLNIASYMYMLANRKTRDVTIFILSQLGSISHPFLGFLKLQDVINDIFDILIDSERGCRGNKM